MESQLEKCLGEMVLLKGENDRLIRLTSSLRGEGLRLESEVETLEREVRERRSEVEAMRSSDEQRIAEYENQVAMLSMELARLGGHQEQKENKEYKARVQDQLCLIAMMSAVIDSYQ